MAAGLAVDYILFVKSDVDLHVNDNEVQATRYVTPKELKDIIDKGDSQLTPWFRLICESRLWDWWECLDHDLSSCVDTSTIHRLK